MLKTMEQNLIKYNIIFFLRALMLLYPIMLLFYQQNGLSAQELFFFQGVSYFTAILAEAPVGYISNNYSRKNLLLTSFSIYLLITFLWILFAGYKIILIGEILFAISKIMMDNAMSGYLYDYLDSQNQKEKMPKYYGYLNSNLALGTTFAAIIGTFIYTKFGTNTILYTQALIISIIIALMASLPKIKISNSTQIKSYKSLSIFIDSLKNILKNKEIKYHIIFSGILTSCSILFALSFQPLIQNSLLPVFMFGVVAFSNHGIRAIASFCAHKFKNFDLKRYALALFGFYLISFILIINSFEIENPIYTTVTILIICIIIGFQLIFTILHIARLHTFVTIENRGSLMSINNFVSRLASAIILLTSRFFVNKSGFEIYYLVIFTFVMIFGTYLIINMPKVRRNV